MMRRLWAGGTTLRIFALLCVFNPVVSEFWNKKVPEVREADARV